MNDTRFESCIKCTVCTTTCPVSRVNPRYPGPKQAGPDGERLRLKDGALYDEALKYCINCKRCEVACPSDVKIGDIIQRARAQYGQQKPTLRDAILSGANNIANQRTRVDELNVFPVPDGDTGTNMSMTIGAARAGVFCEANLLRPDHCKHGIAGLAVGRHAQPPKAERD